MCGIAGRSGATPGPSSGGTRPTAPCSKRWRGAGRTSAVCTSAGAAALIHARLAVVDLENGLQPMQLDWQGETYVLVYNGELYNTPELRAALAARGHSFNGHSDTEVLLHAFAEWAQTACPGATVFLRLRSGSRTQVRCFWRGTAAASSRCSTRRRRTR